MMKKIGANVGQVFFTEEFIASDNETLIKAVKPYVITELDTYTKSEILNKAYNTYIESFDETYFCDEDLESILSYVIDTDITLDQKIRLLESLNNPQYSYYNYNYMDIYYINGIYILEFILYRL